MKVELLHHTPIFVTMLAIRKCWDSLDKSDSWYDVKTGEYGSKESDDRLGHKDKELIHRVGVKNHHGSTLEHITYNFDFDGVSRALLQELARHRIQSLSVKSTRYTLKELKNECEFSRCDDMFVRLFLNREDVTEDNFFEIYKKEITPEADISKLKTYIKSKKDFERAKKYLVYTGNELVDEMSIKALDNLRLVLKKGISNDKAKYCLPESYKTSLVSSFNLRSLQNFLFLRSDKGALKEIRDLAHAMYESLPEDHKYLLDNFIKDEIDE